VERPQFCKFSGAILRAHIDGLEARRPLHAVHALRVRRLVEGVANLLDDSLHLLGDLLLLGAAERGDAGEREQGEQAAYGAHLGVGGAG
jgi:hypothetical protein